MFKFEFDSFDDNFEAAEAVCTEFTLNKIDFLYDKSGRYPVITTTDPNSESVYEDWFKEESWFYQNWCPESMRLY